MAMPRRPVGFFGFAGVRLPNMVVNVKQKVMAIINPQPSHFFKLMLVMSLNCVKEQKNVRLILLLKSK